MEEQRLGRRSLMTRLGGAVAALGLGAGSAGAQTRSSGFQPARHAKDDWFDEVPGKHRNFIDSSTPDGVGEALHFAGNLYRANQSGYALGDADVAIVICLRHGSTLFAYNDTFWAKYGGAFPKRLQLGDPETNKAPEKNPHSDAIAEVAKRGTRFAVCEISSRGLARGLANATGGDGDAVFAEMTANLIPNGHFVAAGVLGVNRAQERGYTLLTVP